MDPVNGIPVDEVQKEINGWASLGFEPVPVGLQSNTSFIPQDGKRHVYAIPFHYHQFPSLPQACVQTVQALRLLFEATMTQGRVAYFHCTVGEDRTGLLAGLYRMLVQNWSAADAWNKEMCFWGYGSGDPKKPANVDEQINQDLTPFFLRMAKLIQTGRLSVKTLNDASVCNGFEQIPVNPAQMPSCSSQSHDLLAPN